MSRQVHEVVVGSAPSAITSRLDGVLRPQGYEVISDSPDTVVWKRRKADRASRLIFGVMASQGRNRTISALYEPEGAATRVILEAEGDLADTLLAALTGNG